VPPSIRIGLLTEMPGRSWSTRKAVISGRAASAGEVSAMRMVKSALSALLIQIFVPLIDQPPSTLRARVFMRDLSQTFWFTCGA
jgi:hypothetical protein